METEGQLCPVCDLNFTKPLKATIEAGECSDASENCLREWSFRPAASDSGSIDIYGFEEARIFDLHIPPAFWEFLHNNARGEKSLLLRLESMFLTLSVANNNPAKKT